MMRRILGALVGATLLFGVDAPRAEAHGKLGDSVVGSGTVVLLIGDGPETITTTFDIEARSAPSGENPQGQVALPELWSTGIVACLEVRTIDIGTEFDEATMNLVTPEQGLVTLEVSDGDPEGLPDFISIRTFSSRSPTDCSPLPFGTATHRGELEGEVDFVNNPPPTSPEQCRRGGWRKLGYEKIRQCLAAVQP